MRSSFLTLPLIVLLVGCSDPEARFPEIKSKSVGCYGATDFPMVQITDEAISFGSSILSSDFKFSTFGRTAHTLISIRPRLYLSSPTPGEWIYEEDPRLKELGEKQGKNYSAQWAVIPEGMEGDSLELIAPGKSAIALARVDCM